MLDIGHLENSHSNMLAWLFDANGGNQAGSVYFRNIVSRFSKEMYDLVDMEWEYLLYTVNSL